MNCRCGFTEGEFHPCHYAGYTCRKPATQRFYNPELVSLAGTQMKIQITDTWACDECWEKFNEDLLAIRERTQN